MRLDPDIAQELFSAAQAMTGTGMPPGVAHHDRLQRVLVKARANDLANREWLQQQVVETEDALTQVKLPDVLPTRPGHYGS